MSIEQCDTSKIYKTQWKAYYKTGLGAPAIVYGESEREAINAALALYRYNCTLVDMTPAEKIVDHIEYIG